MFNKGDFVKSKLDPFVTGLIKEDKPLTFNHEVRQYKNSIQGSFDVIPGYIITTASGLPKWIAAQDLELIAANPDVSSEPENSENE